jgi:hypothetical protein
MDSGHRTLSHIYPLTFVTLQGDIRHGLSSETEQAVVKEKQVGISGK